MVQQMLYYNQKQTRKTKKTEGENMTAYEIRNEVKNLIIRKGIRNIINADLNEIHNRTGATYTQLQNAMSYFRFSPQAAKYRA